MLQTHSVIRADREGEAERVRGTGAVVRGLEGWSERKSRRKAGKCE